jgi:hypothetical protein
MVGPETKFFGFFPPHRSVASPQAWHTALEQIKQIAQRDQMHLEWAEDELNPSKRTHHALFKAWLHALGRPHQAQWIGDASNVHTPYILHLANLFPQAKIIHLFRDPRDVVASQSVAWDTSIIRGSLRWWRAYKTHLKAQVHLSSHQYYSLKYEDLVMNPQDTINALCTWMNWTYHPDLLSPHLRKQTGFAPRETHKLDTLKPITSAKMGQYKQRLTSEDFFWVERICSQGMKALEYTAHESISLTTLTTSPRYFKQSINLLRGK